MIEEVRKAPEQARALFPYVRRTLYRDACTRTKEEQAQLLEKMRYKTYLERSLSRRLMQRLGDFGREMFPWMARGGWRF